MVDLLIFDRIKHLTYEKALSANAVLMVPNAITIEQGKPNVSIEQRLSLIKLQTLTGYFDNLSIGLIQGGHFISVRALDLRQTQWDKKQLIA
jgi:hypothetical protein